MCLVLAYEGVWAISYPNYTVPNAFGSVQAGAVAKTAQRNLTRCCGSQKWAYERFWRCHVSKTLTCHRLAAEIR